MHLFMPKFIYTQKVKIMKFPLCLELWKKNALSCIFMKCAGYKTTKWSIDKQINLLLISQEVRFWAIESNELVTHGSHKNAAPSYPNRVRQAQLLNGVLMVQQTSIEGQGFRYTVGCCMAGENGHSDRTLRRPWKSSTCRLRSVSQTWDRAHRVSEEVFVLACDLLEVEAEGTPPIRVRRLIRTSALCHHRRTPRGATPRRLGSHICSNRHPAAGEASEWTEGSCHS